MFKMTHYISRSADGLVHVTNAAGGMVGQHHVHTEKEFGKWAEGIEASAIVEMDKAKCNCGLKAGEVKN